MPCWPRAQVLRKYSSKDFKSYEMTIEKETNNYSDYKGSLNAFEWIELQIQIAEILVKETEVK